MLYQVLLTIELPMKQVKHVNEVYGVKVCRISSAEKLQPPDLIHSTQQLSSTFIPRLRDVRPWPNTKLITEMAKPQPSWGLGIPGPDTPASPRTLRTLRKIQSHQVLSSSSALIAQTQASHQSGSHDTEPAGLPGAATRARAHRRARSNSDAAAREAAAAPPATQRRPARKTGSGIGLKRSLLENFLRDGPPSDPREGLQELKYLVLSSRVDADGDGMVSASIRFANPAN